MGPIGESRHFTEVHRPRGDDAYLNAIAEGIVTIGGVGVGFMPGNQIWIRTPVSFFAVEALQNCRIAFFTRAQVDMRSSKTLRAALGDLSDFAHDQ